MLYITPTIITNKVLNSIFFLPVYFNYLRHLTGSEGGEAIIRK